MEVVVGDVGEGGARGGAGGWGRGGGWLHDAGQVSSHHTHTDRLS